METDICFTNTLSYLGILSQVKFGAIRPLVNRKEKIKPNGLITVCKLHGVRGFTIRVINADNEFECLREYCMTMEITLNVATAKYTCSKNGKKIQC